MYKYISLIVSYALSKILLSSHWRIGELLRPISVLKSTWNWAYSETQAAACAIISDFRLMTLGIKSDCLVSRIEAGHIALSAVDTQVIVDFGEFLFFRHVVDVVEVMITCPTYILQSRYLT